MRATGDSSVLQRLASEGLSFAKKPTNSKKNGKKVEGENKENSTDNKRDFHGGHAKAGLHFSFHLHICGFVSSIITFRYLLFQILIQKQN